MLAGIVVEGILVGIILILLDKKHQQYKKKYPNNPVLNPEKKIKQFKKDIEKSLKQNDIEKNFDDLMKETDSVSASGKPAFDANKVQKGVEQAMKKHFPEIYAEAKSTLKNDLKPLQIIAKTPTKAKSFKSQGTSGQKLKKLS